MNTKKRAVFAIISLLLLSNCGGKAKAIRGKYPVPPNIEFPGETMSTGNLLPLDIYWSNSASERGFFPDTNGNYSDFTKFFSAFRNTYRGFEPTIFTLQTGNAGHIEWGKAPEPNISQDYIGSDYKVAEQGPLYMIYQQNPDIGNKLTVVVNDLNEQGLNCTVLAETISKNLANYPDSGAAIIALRLPYYGTTYKPNPNNMKELISSYSRGEKLPLYVIATGPKKDLWSFLEQFSLNLKDSGLDLSENGVYFNIISTIGNSAIQTLTASDFKSPLPDADPSDLRVFKKNYPRIRDNIAVLRNNPETGIPEKNWNLDDQTNAMVDKFITKSGDEIETQLPLKLFRYKTIAGAKKENRLWQLNIGFDIPEGYDVSQLEMEIADFNYLVEETEIENNKRKKVRSWKSNSVYFDRDFITGLTPNGSTKAVAYVLPSDTRRGGVESPVIWFVFVVKAFQNTNKNLPQWAFDYNNSTQDFTAFIRIISGIKNTEELVKVPVVLYNLPAKK